MEGMQKSQAELQVRVTELTNAVRCIVWLSAPHYTSHHTGLQRLSLHDLMTYAYDGIIYVLLCRKKLL